MKVLTTFSVAIAGWCLALSLAALVATTPVQAFAAPAVATATAPL